MPPEHSRSLAERELLHLVLVDPDPIFRSGLRLWIERSADLRVVAEFGDGRAALAVVRKGMDLEKTAGTAAKSPLDLVILDPEVQVSPDPESAFLFQQLKWQFPSLPLLLLGRSVDPALLSLAYQMGVEGYCPKGTDIETLHRLIQQLAKGGRSWPATLIGFNLPNRSTPSSPAPGLISRWRYQLASSGLREMEMALAAAQLQLNRGRLSWLERKILEGQQREIRCARWLVLHLLPASPPVEFSSDLPINRPPVPPSAVLPAPTLQTLLIESTLAKISTGLPNLTGAPLEIEILHPEKRQELVAIVLHQLEELLASLQAAQLTPLQLAERRSQVLEDLWQNSTTDFFGRYKILDLPTHPPVEIPLVSTLLQDRPIVATAILVKIPLVVEFLSHLLLKTPLAVDNAVYPVGSPDAVRRCEMLCHNLVLQVANAVIQPLLNRFAQIEAIKQSFYQQQMLSTRELERFRNALSWKYRYQSWFSEPQEVFESRVSLIVLGDRGLEKRSIYLPRNQELQQLQGIPFLVTIALEFRDAVAPPLRISVAFLGRGLIYLLTQVIGRGIGLIGRGIFQGLGHSWQDLQATRRSRN